HVNIAKTCAWINAIAISKPENAIIKAKGTKPSIKNIKPLVIILKVNPLKIVNRRCPATIFAASLSPKEILRAKYDRSIFLTFILFLLSIYFYIIFHFQHNYQ